MLINFSAIGAAETVQINPPLVDGRAIYAGADYLMGGTRTLIIDKVCEALGYKEAQSTETHFAVVTGAQEFAFVARGDQGGLRFYFYAPGRPDKKETIGYLTKLTCLK
jgi:hypothetical protein